MTNSPFAFLLCLPPWKSNGQLAFKEDGYDVTYGRFIFPDCGFGIYFKPDKMVQMIFAQRLDTHGSVKPVESDNFSKLGLSMQISQRTTNSLDHLSAQEFVTKNPNLYVGDVPHILNKINQ